MYQSRYWREKLKRKDLRAVSKVDNCIDRAEAGNFGDHKLEQDGVWEMRIDYGPGYRCITQLREARSFCS